MHGATAYPSSRRRNGQCDGDGADDGMDTGGVERVVSITHAFGVVFLQRPSQHQSRQSPGTDTA
jgi:hypothetical protein